MWGLRLIASARAKKMVAMRFEAAVTTGFPNWIERNAQFMKFAPYLFDLTKLGTKRNG